MPNAKAPYLGRRLSLQNIIY